MFQLVKEHQQPTPSFIVQRYDFHTRVQQLNESISDFVAQLRILSEHCRFGDQLDEILRDRLVCGCRNKQLQCKLLTESELSYDKAFKLARAAETAQQEAKELHSNAEHPVNQVRPGQRDITPRKPSITKESCYRCGAKHAADTCRFKTAICNYCHKQGHIASVCFKKARDSKKKPLAKRTHQLHMEEQAASLEYSMFYAATPRTDPIRVTLSLNTVDHSMEVDTGATLSVISERTYNTLWSGEQAPTLRPSSSRLKMYTGEPIKV